MQCARAAGKHKVCRASPAACHDCLAYTCQ